MFKVKLHIQSTENKYHTAHRSLVHGDTLPRFPGEELAFRAGIMVCDESSVLQLQTLVVFGAVARVQDTHSAGIRQVSLHKHNGEDAHVCNIINVDNR